MNIPGILPGRKKKCSPKQGKDIPNVTVKSAYR